MTISAKVIADSVSTAGVRLTTLQLRYPRFIHAEFMTHREFSRNASSSRAIPVEKLLADVEEDPAAPLHWGKNQRGMQAEEELDPEQGLGLWMDGCRKACAVARDLAAAGYHKQVVNRIIEPYSHINVLVSSTNWANFFALRRHPDAQPEIQAVADAVFFERERSKPRLLQAGEWHLPFADDEETELACLAQIEENRLYGGVRSEAISLQRMVSVARCARVSYLTQRGTRSTVIEDIALFSRLMGSEPLHASPAEHQATPDPAHERPEWHGNFSGWSQYRKTFPNEYVQETKA